MRVPYLGKIWLTLAKVKVTRIDLEHAEITKIQSMAMFQLLWKCEDW